MTKCQKCPFDGVCVAWAIRPRTEFFATQSRPGDGFGRLFGALSLLIPLARRARHQAFVTRGQGCRAKLWRRSDPRIPSSTVKAQRPSVPER